jgi:hypothetical protein
VNITFWECISRGLIDYPTCEEDVKVLSEIHIPNSLTVLKSKILSSDEI